MRIKEARLRDTRAWLLLAIGALFSTVAHAGQGVWTSGGPYGGVVSALAVDPATPSTLYAGKSTESIQGSGGLFKSTDSGGTWVASDELRGPDVRALAIDPSTPSTLYAGTSGVYKSIDSGGTWAATGLPDEGVFALAINPSTPSTLYAGTVGGIFKSIDSGDTWAAANTGLTNLVVRALAINPSTPSTLYAGTVGGIFRSTDSGSTWAAANTGLTNLDVSALAINPSADGTLYAATSGGVFKSSNSGGTWAAVNAGLTNLAVRTLTINPSTPSTLYAGTDDGEVFKSTDSGGTWVAVKTGLTNRAVLALAINPSTPSTLYAGTGGGGVFKSTDSGGIWTATGLTNTYQRVSALAINPSTPSTLYAGTTLSSVGVFRSTNSGATWAPADTGLQLPWVTALAIDPVTPSTLYAGTLLYVLGVLSGVSKSTDSGATWADSAGLPAVVALVVNPSTPSTLYAGTGGGVFKSIDAGGSWAAVNTGLANLDVRALVIDPVTPSTLYAASAPSPPQGTAGVVLFGEVFKSNDSGATWASANTGLPNQSVSALAINPKAPTTLYAGTNGSGVYKSTDSGGAWSSVNAGLTNYTVQALAINPSTPTTLYAATEGGVFKSTDSAGTWAAVNTGLPGPPYGFTALALDPTGPTTLYAGLGNKGVWQSTPPPDGIASVEGVVPIVLDVTGLAHYTSELQLTNLGATTTTVKLSYTGSIGSGVGEVLETIPAGQQVVYPDALSHLRVRGVPIPASGSQGGTLFLSAPAAGIHATVRTGSDTAAPQPIGRAGLTYTDTAPASSLNTKIVYGLRASGKERSNLAVYNMGADPVSLTVTLGGFNVTAGVPLVLPAYGWHQYSGVLNDAGLSSGYAIVYGNGPFGAYGVVNDQITNDGSFIPGVSDTPRGSKLTVPVLVETSAFESELILASREIPQPGSFTPPVTFTLRYVESLSPAKGQGGTTTVELAFGEQRIIPNAIDFLRSKGVSIGARGDASYAGSLQVQASGGGLPVNVFAGARTSALSPTGGEFGVFYPAIDSSQEFSALAYVLGLKADADNRSNVAVLHTGADSSGPITLELQVLDGSEGGAPVGQPLSVNLNPGQWAQPSGFFAGGGVPNGYVRIRRTAGTAPWYAYGVINDGGQPGQRTGDGSYVPGVQP